MTAERLISCILEVHSLILIWCKFEKDNNRHFIFKNIGVVAFAIVMVIITVDLEPLSSFIINYGFLVILLSTFYRKSFVDSLIKIIIAYACVMLVEFLILIAFVAIYGLSLNTQDPNILILANVVLSILTIMIYTNKKLDKLFSRIHTYLSGVRFKFRNIWIINTLVYCMFIKLIWDYSPIYLMNYRFFILIISILIYIIHINIFRTDLLQQQKASMEENYNKYSPVMQMMVEEVKSKQHEFKNHINAMYGIVQLAEDSTLREELATYLESLNISLSEADILKCRHSIVNAIIYTKACEARDNEIDFKYYVEDIEELPIKPYEMSEVLSNLLNNAIEEALNNVKGNRLVELIITDDDTYTNIEVKNTVSDIKNIKMDKIFKKGYSTKNRGSGYGLYNLKKIVDDNKGKLMVTIDSGCISFSIKFKRKAIIAK